MCRHDILEANTFNEDIHADLSLYHVYVQATRQTSQLRADRVMNLRPDWKPKSGGSTPYLIRIQWHSSHGEATTVSCPLQSKARVR